MSLWLQSLDSCLVEYAEDIEKRAKCILAHLSMRIPRTWWHEALKRNEISENHINVLKACQKYLIDIYSLQEFSDILLLIALAFIDENLENHTSTFGNIENSYSVEEYLTKAKGVLYNNSKLRKLSNIIEGGE